MKLLMLKGLPGSGKSTWAKTFTDHNPEWVRINKDSIRQMIGGYEPKKESLVLQFRNAMIDLALKDGKNVIVDDTNFHPKHEQYFSSLAEQSKGEVKFDVKIFDTPLEVCIENDLKRLNSVGQKVIRKMWSQYLAPRKAPVHDIRHPALPLAVICDLDGTLALHDGRSPYDVEKCDTDRPHPVIKDILYKTNSGPDDVSILFVTGREEKYRKKTSEWLKKNFGGFVELWMRPTGDRREDSIVKQEIYDSHIRGRYNVSFVLDDRDRVVDMWRRNGLTCLQVADGDF